jgi:hypothetical protein
MSALQRRFASGDDASSDEWFARYVLDAVFLVALVLAAIGVSWYLEGGDYLRDWSREPGATFLLCMVLCPVLGIVTLGFVIYAGIRLFLRPHTFGHALVRLTFLIAHAFIFLVCIDTVSSTATALVGSFEQVLPGTGSAQSWTAVQGRDYSGSEYDVREGSPDDSPSPPSRFGPSPAGPPAQGGGTRSP